MRGEKSICKREMWKREKKEREVLKIPKIKNFLAFWHWNFILNKNSFPSKTIYANKSSQNDPITKKITHNWNFKLDKTAHSFYLRYEFSKKLFHKSVINNVWLLFISITYDSVIIHNISNCDSAKPPSQPTESKNYIEVGLYCYS